MTQEGHNRPPDDRLDAYDPPCPEDTFRNATAHDALVHAWDILRMLVGRVGDPFQLWCRWVMKRSKLFEAFDLLRPVETMLRRLILIEAGALAPTLPAPVPAKLRPARTRLKPVRDMEESQNWRAPFRNLAPTRPPRPYRYRPPAQPDPLLRVKPRDSEAMVTTWLLARRIEAAIRVACNPIPWIRRLAHRIRRRGAPDLTRLPRPQRLRHHRAGPTLAALNDALDASWPAHDSS